MPKQAGELEALKDNMFLVVFLLVTDVAASNVTDKKVVHVISFKNDLLSDNWKGVNSVQ